MCFNLLNLCLPASNSTSSTSKLAKTPLNSSKSRTLSSSSSVASADKVRRLSPFSKTAPHALSDQNLPLKPSTPSPIATTFKASAPLKSKRIFKKSNRSNTSSSFENFHASAQSLTFRLFNSKSNLNYFSFDSPPDTYSIRETETEFPHQLGFLTSSSLSSSTVSSTHSSFSITQQKEHEPKMSQDDFNRPTTSSSANANNNSSNNFVFLSPRIPPRPLFNSMRSTNIGHLPTISRPILTSPGFINKPQINLQSELKLGELQIKKQSYHFNTDQLFAKPNELLRDNTSIDDDLSSALDEQLNNSKMDVDEPHGDASFARDNQHRGSGNSQHKHHHHHHHHHHSGKHKARGGKLTIAKEQVFDFKEADLQDLGQIGNGEFGTVHKVIHLPSQTPMALKRIGPTVGNQVERKKVLKELDFVLECNENPYVVKFYGVKFNNEPVC